MADSTAGATAEARLPACVSNGVVQWRDSIPVSNTIDWITGTTLDARSSENLATAVNRVNRWELAAGGIRKGWGLAGFSGFKVGQLEVGVRGDECMVRLMSECAHLHWRKVYRAADKCTRIDLQSTFDVGCDPQPLVWAMYHMANAHEHRWTREPVNRVILGNDGGATLYCGARTSNMFGRIYAREAKSKDKAHRNHLRFEVQFNKKLAGMAARDCAAAPSIEHLAFSRVSAFFRTRGLSVPGHASSVPNYSLRRSRSDCDKRLAWLEKSVRASCMMLAERGLTEQLVTALGLDEFVSIRRR